MCHLIHRHREFREESSVQPLPPPHPTTAQGRQRRVGVEIEFAGIMPDTAARLVAECFGGDIVRQSPHRMSVEGTPWGKFTIELDSKYVHPDATVMQANGMTPGKAPSAGREWRVEFHQRSREWLGEMVAGLVPTEIVSPPIPWSELGEFDRLFDALRRYGAEGTDASVFYGFGLHLNPEVPDTGTASVLAHLQAYTILAAWLRDQIRVDLTREILPHTNPFPKAYALKILAPDYAPARAQLISDYLRDNPTRNRELDMCPLFAHLAPESAHPLLHESLVKPRPTFHYRLPNAQLNAPGWGSVTEWNRWVTVERLAADAHSLHTQRQAYCAHHTQSTVGHWLDKLKRWVEG
ncbi:amidoligase family protein [Chromohalobacter israelensis]|nr:amidoligase family protein [Chromohalobacter israelensis]MDF9432949.1 amidoligase family protein [Chromohalobacter israelensis]